MPQYKKISLTFTIRKDLEQQKLRMHSYTDNMSEEDAEHTARYILKHHIRPDSDVEVWVEEAESDIEIPVELIEFEHIRTYHHYRMRDGKIIDAIS